MTILPREQVTQRHRNSTVSAPGVTLWMSETDLAICDVEIMDDVTYGEVEQATGPDPYMEWDVETFNDPHPDFPGVYRSPEYGQGAYGELTYGFELEYNEGTDGPYTAWVSDDGMGE
jgi:hypothetical protein